MMSGTVTVQRPRVRDLTDRFESKMLPHLKRRTQEVGTSCTCMGWPLETLSWPCVAYWVRAASGQTRRYKRAESAQAIIWKMLRMAE
jgi:hypothetical protein